MVVSHVFCIQRKSTGDVLRVLQSKQEKIYMISIERKKYFLANVFHYMS